MFPLRDSEREAMLKKEKRAESKKETPSLSKNEYKRLKARLGEIEDLLSRLDERKAQIESQMEEADFYRDAEKSAAVLEEYNQIPPKREALEEEWINATYKLENSEE